MRAWELRKERAGPVIAQFMWNVMVSLSSTHWEEIHFNYSHMFDIIANLIIYRLLFHRLFHRLLFHRLFHRLLFHRLLFIDYYFIDYWRASVASETLTGVKMKKSGMFVYLFRYMYRRTYVILYFDPRVYVLVWLSTPSQIVLNRILWFIDRYPYHPRN